MDAERSTRAVADRQAIIDQIHRYARSVDRLDAEVGYACWHEDGTADYGDDIYQGSGRGFIDFCLESHRHALMHSHQMTNTIVDLDGDRASSETYAIVAVRSTSRANPDKIMQYMSWTRYLDTWSLQNGRWAIDHRYVIIDFDIAQEVDPAIKAWRGTRDRGDPSYGVLFGERKTAEPV
jgi:hypothetical protein